MVLAQTATRVITGQTRIIEPSRSMPCAPIATSMLTTVVFNAPVERWAYFFSRAAFFIALASFFLTMFGCSVSKNKPILKTDPGGSVNITEGIKAYQNGDFERARLIFNKIIESKTDPSDLEEAQWYLAQIAEKQGKLNEAVKQYTLFSENFPSSKHLPAVKERLAALTKTSTLSDGPLVSTPGPTVPSGSSSVSTSGLTVPSGSSSVSTQGPNVPSGNSSVTPQGAPTQQNFLPMRRQETGLYGKFSGALTIEYLYDTQTSPPDPTPTLQNRLNEYLDFRWRKSAGGDLKIYFSGMNSNDFLTPDNSYYRLNKLFADWSDSRALVDLRIGRQPASGNTLFSRFDGLAFGLRPSSTLGLTASVGYAVDPFDRNQVQIQHDRLFYDTYLSVYDLYHLGGKIYYTQEFNNGFSTRNAVGLNGFWLNNAVNISSIVDYDLDFKQFNDKLLSLEYHYLIASYFAAVEYRKNPFLDYETALLAPSLALATPPVTSFDVLRETMTRGDIKTLALDNTTDSREVRLGTTLDFTKVWHADLRYAHTDFQSIVFNDGKVDKKGDRYSVFLSERNGLHWSEIGTLLYLYQPTTDYQTTTVTGTFAKYWGPEFQTSLRCRWERFVIKTSATRSTRIIPGFSLIYTFSGGIYASIDADYDIDMNTTTNETVKIVETRTSITIPF
jgi:tetratricopeptide (TPR) repeat protein